MRWSWEGIAAVILALTLGGGYAAAIILSALEGHELDSGTLQAMTNLGGILAGALAGWLGGHAAGRRSSRDDDIDARQ